jgi:hypothetical protein
MVRALRGGVKNPQRHNICVKPAWHTFEGNYMASEHFTFMVSKRKKLKCKQLLFAIQKPLMFMVFGQKIYTGSVRARALTPPLRSFLLRVGLSPT